MVNRRVFILGAGFSAAARLPLGSTLSEQVFKYRWRDLSTNLSNKSSQATSSTFGSEVKDEEQRLARVLFSPHNFEDNFPDFEMAMTILDDAAQYERDITSRHPLNPLQIARLRDGLLDDMANLIADQSQPPSQPINDFVSKLDPKRDAIISFNWDTLLESAAMRLNAAGQPLSNPFFAIDSTGSGIPLLKLHGSLDLAEISTAQWEHMRNSVNVHGLRSLDPPELKGQDTLLLQGTDPTQVNNRVVGPFKSALVVMPTYRKEYRSPWIRARWVNALRLLQNTDDIRVIGFSFPPADTRPETLIKFAASIRSNSRTPPPNLMVVDPHGTPRAVSVLHDAFRRDPHHILSRWQDVLKQVIA